MLREDMIVGVHIGEHGFDADKVLDELRVRIV